MDIEELIELWDDYDAKYAESDRIDTVLDGNNFIMYFKAGKEVYGAPEESRLVFSRMKSPDEELPKDWAKDADFVGYNLNKMLKGKPAEQIFGSKDLPKIKIIDRDQAAKLLKNKDTSINKKEPSEEIHVINISTEKDPAEAPNFLHAKEK